MKEKSALRSIRFHCAYSHAIACLVSDNHWLDIIKLISVIKEVPLPKAWSRGNSAGRDRK